MQRYLGFVLVLITVLLSISMSMAHGDLHSRIRNVSKLISESPHDLQLYQQRGALYLQHRQFRKAWRDFRKCERKGFVSDRLWFAMAQTAFWMEKDAECRHYLNRLLSKEDMNLPATRLLAQVEMRNGNFLVAAALFEQIITGSIRVIPENYLDAADALDRAGLIDGAVKLLEKGLIDMGPVPVFQERLIIYYISQGRYDDAIEIRTWQVHFTSRREFPLTKRAELYLRLGDTVAAQEDLEEAVSAIGNLPRHIKTNRAVLELAEQVQNIKLQISSEN